jgi:hypothetical protein
MSQQSTQAESCKIAVVTGGSRGIQSSRRSTISGRTASLVAFRLLQGSRIRPCDYLRGNCCASKSIRY